MKTMEKPILSNERRKTISKAIELCLESFNRKEAISRIVDFVEDEKKLTYDVAKFKNAYNELSKKIETYYDTLQNEIYGYMNYNEGNTPKGIIVHYHTWSDMAHYPLIRPSQRKQKYVQSFMGIKVIRTYDIEEGEFLIF